MAEFASHADHPMPWLSIDHKASTHARPQGEHAEVLNTTAGSGPFLAQCGTVRVVFKDYRRAQPVFQFPSHWIICPTRQVGRGVQGAGSEVDNSRNTNADSQQLVAGTIFPNKTLDRGGHSGDYIVTVAPDLSGRAHDLEYLASVLNRGYPHVGPAQIDADGNGAHEGSRL